MQLVQVSGRYNYKVTRNCNYSVQNGQRCQEIYKCNNFKTHYDKFTQIFTEIGVFPIFYLRSFGLFSQHNCQVVYL